MEEVKSGPISQEVAPKESIESVENIPLEENNETSELQAKIEDPKISKVEKKVIEKKLKKIKYQYEGKEFEQEYDPEDDNFIREQIQLAKMSRERARQKNELENEVMAFINDLKNNPAKALSDPNIGVDIKALARQVIEQEIADSKKSPLELELEKERAEKRKLLEDAKKQKEDFDKREFDRLKEVEFQKFDTEVTKALESKKIPNKPAVIKRIADYLTIAYKAKKDVSIEDIIPIVRDEMKSDYRDLGDSLSDDDLEEFFGKNNLDRYRKKMVAKSKSNPALKSPTKTMDTGKSNNKPVNKPEEKVSFKNFFKLNK